MGLIVLLAACGNPSGSPGSGSAQIAGTVTAGPSCPVEQLASPCPNRPVPAASVQAVQGTSVAASTRTDSAGRYRLTLGPGAYLIIATNTGAYRSTAQRPVTAVAGQPMAVDLTVDTGIR